MKLRWLLVTLTMALATVALADRRALLRAVKPAAAGGGAFTYYSAVFDGTSDYLTKTGDLTGIADGDKGLLSFWIKAQSDFDLYYILRANPSYLYIQRTAGDDISIVALNPSAATVLELTSSGSGLIFNDGAWHHILASWDLSQSAKSWIYIDGVDRTTRTTHTVGGTINYAASLDWAIGARPDDGTGKLNALVCELYFTTEYLDLSSSGNRDKFFNSGTSKPVDLGATGSTPTGTQPLLYFRTQVPNWEVNVGSGGTFTENGTLADGGSDKP